MNIIAQIQTLLSEAGFNPGIIDGIWGAKSQAALDTAAESLRTRTESPPAAPNVIPVFMGDPVDARSEKAIRTLHVAVQPLARALVRKAFTANIKIVVTSGSRTYEEQDQLFRQAHDGRDNDGDGRVDESDEMVTKARAGFSNHNFSLAFDVTIFREDGTPVWESSDYAKVGVIGKGLGLFWGGDFKSPVDEPHFELHPPWASKMSESDMIAELRRRHDNGTDAFA